MGKQVKQRDPNQMLFTKYSARTAQREGARVIT